MQLIARLHLPAQYNTSNSVAVPLLLDFHGWTGTAHDQESADIVDSGQNYCCVALDLLPFI